MPFADGPNTHITKSKIKDSRHLRQIAISRPRSERFWRNLAQWCSLSLLTARTVKNLKFQKSKMATAGILKIQKIAISRPRFQWFRRNLAWWRSSTFLTVWTFTNLKFKNLPLRRPPFWKIQKSRYFGNGLSDQHDVWHCYAYWLSEQVRRLKFPTLTNQRWRTAAILKIQ